MLYLFKGKKLSEVHILKALNTGLMALIFWAGNASAEWTLDNQDSSLSFISIKAGSVAETHRFKNLSGDLDNQGNASISIDADSIDTGIDIRDTRMRSLLLDVENYPVISVQAKVDQNRVSAMEPGQKAVMDTEMLVTVRNQTLAVTAPLLVTMLDDKRLMVTTQQAIIVNAGQLDLLAGIEQLRQVAGLPSIAPAVPVNFVLTFDHSEKG